MNMKKITLFLAVVIFVGNVYSQFTPGMGTQVEPSITHDMDEKVADTVFTYYDRATGFYMYSSTGGGYVFGVGLFNSIKICDETAMHYDAVANSSVTEVLTWFGTIDVVGDADAMSIGVYTVDGDTLPVGGAICEESMTFADITTTDLNSTIFTTPGATNGQPFMCFVAFTASSDDTLGIVCSDPTTNDGQGENRARMKLTADYGGAWISVNMMYSGTMDADAMIIPVLDITIGTDDFMFTNGLTLKGTYPNPASEFTTIKYALDKPENVRIHIFDITGKTVVDTGKLPKEAGDNEYTIDFSNMSAGKYYYTINSETATITSRIIVVK